jgi:hypothetical protein
VTEEIYYIGQEPQPDVTAQSAHAAKPPAVNGRLE